jgi:predicted nucleic acid-binding protein
LVDIICNTSPLQYLHQLGFLPLLPALTDNVIVPTAVVKELETGRALRIDLPNVTMLDWVKIKQPVHALALPLVTDLGAGETEVLALVLEHPRAVAILNNKDKGAAFHWHTGASA